MADLFLSYAREDLERARELAGALAAEGWSVFWDRRIPPGRTFEDYIEQQVRECRALVVMWSPHAVTSKWVKIEAAVARERDVLVPVLIASVQVPFGYGHLHAADLTSWWPDTKSLEFEELVGAIESFAPRTGQSASPDLRPPALPKRDTKRVGNDTGAPTVSSRPADSANTADHQAMFPVETVAAPSTTDIRPVEVVTAVTGSRKDRVVLVAGLVFRYLRWRLSEITTWRRLTATLLIVVGGYLLYRFTRDAPQMPDASRRTSGEPTTRSLPPGASAPPKPSMAVAVPADASAGYTSGSSSSTAAPSGPGLNEKPKPAGPVQETKVRFRSDMWNLPDEPLLGFVEISAGPFMMGSTRYTFSDLNEIWTPAGEQGTLSLATFYIARYPVTDEQFYLHEKADDRMMTESGGTITVSRM